MSKKNLMMKGFVSDGNSDDVDVLGFYRNVFPSAIPLVYNHGEENLLESRLQEVYGDSFFLIYKPLGMMGFMRDNKMDQKSFHLILIKNSYVFDKYVDFFFTGIKSGSWNTNNFKLRKDKIKCFGSVKLLMMDRDEKSLFSHYRDAISLAFKDGSNPVGKRTAVSYLYHDNRLVETPTFLMWNEQVDNGFVSNKEDF